MESNDTKVHRTRLSRFFRVEIIKPDPSWMKAIDVSNYGVLFFALATIAFGIQNFIYGDFVMGRAPAWPSAIPGQIVWAYVSGAILVLLGTAIILRKNPIIAAICIAILVFAWALLRHIFYAHWSWGTEITQTGKALVLFGGALCTAGVLGDKISNLSYRFVLVGRLSIGTFFIICGIEHFMFVDFVKSLVPAWIPGNLIWTYLTGVALIAGGAGMMIRQTMRPAALLSGIMVFMWVIILHIPRAIMSQGDGIEWVAVFEALAVAGIAFMISARSDGGR